jgi:hypothetical protein
MFKFHPPKDDSVIDAHNTVRATLVSAAKLILDCTPPSVEQDIAIDRIREAMFWSNAAIACNQENRG